MPVVNGLRLEQTSGWCPEQYDVYDNGDNQVGYLRLRHGCFTCEYPDCGGEMLFEASPKGDGGFADDAERTFYLTLAIEAIKLRVEIPGKC